MSKAGKSTESEGRLVTANSWGGGWRHCLWVWACFWGPWKYSAVIDSGGLHNPMNILKCTEIYTFTGWILRYVNFFFWLHQVECGILVPQPGIKPVPPAVEVQSSNHWTTKEVPELFLLKKSLSRVVCCVVFPWEATHVARHWLCTQETRPFRDESSALSWMGLFNEEQWRHSM